ncbi:TPA: XRE family transcriptional regulator [Streptococcus suis 8830]|uniref:DNA-binding protein n=1 Tax=Streptococcus suis TaxID=1307 RepID=UPI0004142B97|nr:DNA-binding protein [Streptococcus suis]HEM3203937.1 XRE family transcriptional regulator [Streptococcus suis 8830]
MIITEKRGKLALTKIRLAKKLAISTKTLVKVEKGNYDAPRRIYESVINWLIEDL